MTNKIEDLAKARRERADAKWQHVDDFAFLALCIADTARNLGAYAHVAHDKPDALNLSKRKLAALIGQDVKRLAEYVRELAHKAAEEEPEFAA